VELHRFASFSLAKQSPHSAHPIAAPATEFRDPPTLAVSDACAGVFSGSLQLCAQAQKKHCGVHRVRVKTCMKVAFILLPKFQAPYRQPALTVS